MGELALPDLQRWFHAVITHPDGVAAGARAAPGGLAPEELIEPSRALAAEQRLGVYSDAYFARLYEVLEEDFPALVALLGADEARALFRAYLIEHPSDHPNLNQLGRRLPGYIERELAHNGGGGGDSGPRAFALDLARLERAVQEVFAAPRGQALAAGDLASLAPEAWGGLRLALSPDVRLLAAAHPVNAWYQAFREGAQGPAPAPARTWVVLYRRDFRVWRLPLSEPQHELLAEFGRGAAGAALGDALAALGARFDLAPLSGELGTWFQDWAGLGLFARPLA